MRKPSGTRSQTSSHSFWDGRSDDRSSIVSSSRVFDNGGDLGHDAGQNAWPSINESRDRLLQHNASSALLWPDSEGFFQSLMAGEGMNWDHALITQPGTAQQESIASVGPCHPSESTRGDELAVVEDGQRAVQTTYSLLTNTVSFPANATKNIS